MEGIHHVAARQLPDCRACVLVLAGNILGGPLTWVFPIVVFAIIPILELVLPAGAVRD